MEALFGIAGYAIFFWAFVFSSRFRNAAIDQWNEGGWLERAFMVFEATLSFFFGITVALVSIGYVAARIVSAIR